MAAEKETPQKRKVGDGTPGPGRKKGVPNKTTTTLKEAILLAAESVGEDGKGKEGLAGYLRRVAFEDTKAFCTLLGKLLPTEQRHGGPNGEALPAGQVVLAPQIVITKPKERE